MSEDVVLRRDDGVLEITIDRPKANAIDVATSRALGEAFLTLRDDPDLRVGIVTGAGERIFCAGWDLKAAADGAEDYETDHGPGGFAGITEVHDLNKPLIAAVNGHACGGGFEIAICCDLIVAAEHAEFWLPEGQRGIIADVASFRLARQLPYRVAMELLLTGRRMGAEEAMRWGFVNRVVPGAEVMESARAIARQLAESAPLALQATKEVVRETALLSMPECFEMRRAGKLEAYQRMLASEDALEGPRAFAEKRDPVWKGR